MGRGTGSLLAALTTAVCLALPSAAGAVVFSNTAPIQPIDPPSGPMTQFAIVSSINVTGFAPEDLIDDVNVTLNDIDGEEADDLDAILVSPQNEVVTVISDSGGAPVVQNVTLSFDDSADAPPPNGAGLVSGLFQPANYAANFDSWATADSFPAGLPAEPNPAGYPSSLAPFINEGPNGTWRLIIKDDSINNGVAIDGGWSLDITADALAENFSDSQFAAFDAEAAKAFNESAPAATFTVTRAGLNGATVQWETTPGKATPGQDYTPQTGTLTFTPGDPNETISVPLINDTGHESTEDFGIRLFNPANGFTLSENARAFIIDDDAAPATLSGTSAGITIPDSGQAAPYPAPIAIGAAAGPITDVKVLLNGVSHTNIPDLAIRLLAPSGRSMVVLSGSGGPDDVANANFSFEDLARDEPLFNQTNAPGAYLPTLDAQPPIFPPPDSTGELPLPLPGWSYAGEDPQGEWRLQIVDTKPGDTGTMASWGLSIETEGAARVSAPANDAVALENSPSAVFQLSRIGSGGSSTVNYSLGGSATAGVDYAGAATGSVTFAAGERTKDIVIPIINDSADEPDETVDLTLTAGGGATIGAKATARLTITDEDPPTPPRVPDRIKPRFIGGLTLTPTTFRAAASGASIASRRRAPIGTRLRYRLSEAATVTFRVQRPTTGRRVGRSCLANTRARAKRRKCTRYVNLTGVITRRSKSGLNSVRFSGRLRNRKLAVGSYRLTGQATDAARNRSSVLTKNFRIAR